MKQYFLSALLIITVQLFSQTNNFRCGTTFEDQFAQEVEYKSAALKSSENHAVSRATIYIPITFHLVGTTSGKERILPSQVICLMDGLNAYFKNHNIVFYIKNFNNINNDAVFTTAGSISSLTTMYNNRDGVTTSPVAGSINIFVVKQIDNSPLGGVTISAYSIKDDWIILRKDQVGIDYGSVLAHELGHFFSLRHTFFGWEDGYNAMINDTCVGTSSPRGIPTENVPRSGAQANCTLGGDYLCDTEADYNEGVTAGNMCKYTGVAKDQNCVKIVTDPKNIMSSFASCGLDYYFSAQQIDILKTNYLLNTRKYLSNAPSPGALLPISGVPIIKQPTNASVLPSLSNIKLDWDDVPNATNYIIEMDRHSGFDIEPIYYLSTTSDFTIPGPLVSGRKYFWRVFAYNAGNYKCSCCSIFTFSPGTSATETISSISQMTISPNPITNGILKMNFINNSAFDGKIKITDNTGKVLINKSQRISEGVYNENIDVQNLSNGMYIFSVENEQGINTEKFVIAK
jgi:hypothetical protein